MMSITENLGLHGQPPQRSVKPDTVELRNFEGQLVSMIMADGSRMDDVRVISAGHEGLRTIWVVAGGSDVFLPVVDVVKISSHEMEDAA
jgi:hypothetical protein